MAIEPISSNIMTQQVSKVEKTAPVEKIEVTGQQAAQVQEFSPVVETQGSASQNGQNQDKDKDGQDDSRNIQDVSPDKVKSAIADINKKIAPTRTQCEFKYHEETHRISITVRDKDTDKVIKEIPPEKTLDMIAKTLELAGILVDEKR
jgi:flagellar protein FlaG